MAKDIGRFIQRIRKSKGLTQKELADQIGVSDKTVSKWENGNGMPDTSMLLPLCEALGITINELLSCERIPSEDYTMRAEENIMALMKENENNKKVGRVSKIIGIVAVCVGVIFMGLSTAGLAFPIMNYIDIPGLVIVALLAVGAVLVSGAKSKVAVMGVLGRTIIPIGALVTIIQVIIVLNYTSGDVVGPNLAVAGLALLYAVIVKIVVELMRGDLG